MAFYDQNLHVTQGHPQELALAIPGGSACCLVCLFTSLQSEHILRTRKVYVLRHLVDIAQSPQGGPDLLGQMCIQHAAFVVPALCETIIACDDHSVLTGLSDLALLLASAGAGIAQMVTETLLSTRVSGEAHGHPQTLPVAVLQLLPQLLEAHGDACAAATRALITTPALCTKLARSLEVSASELGASTTAPLLRLLCAVFGQGGEEAAVLAGELGRQALVCAAGLLAGVAGGGAQWREALAPQAQEELREWCLRLLSTLASSMADAPGSWPQQGLAAPDHLAATLMAGLKPCLLSTHNTSTQLLAVQLVARLCAPSNTHHLNLSPHLIGEDLVEYLCEVIGCTLGGAGGGRKRRAPGAGVGSGGGGGWGVVEELQVQAVGALRGLSSEAGFVEHAACGLDALLGAGEAAHAAANTPLLSEVAALLVGMVAPGGGCGGLRLTAADTLRLVNLAGGVFPDALVPGSTPAALSPEACATYVAMCQLLEGVCGVWVSSAAAWPPSAHPHKAVQAAVVRAVEGTTAVTQPALTDCFAAACGLVHTWMGALGALGGGGGGGKGVAVDKGLTAALQLTREHVLPRLQGLWEDPCGGPAVLPALQAITSALEMVLQHPHWLRQGAAGSGGEGGRDGGGGVVEAGVGLAQALLQGRWVSKLMELMASHHPHLPLLPELCWRLLLMTHALAAPPPTRDNQAPPPSLPSIQEAAAVHAPHSSVEAVMRCLVVQGPGALHPHSDAVLHILAMAHSAGDVCVDLTWLMHALVELLTSCCPDPAGSGSAAATSAKLFATGLDLFMDTSMLAAAHAGAHAGVSDIELPPPLAPLLQRYCQLQPEGVEVGSRLGDWVVSNCEQLGSAAGDMLAGWLRSSVGASRDLFTQVVAHLAGVCPPPALNLLAGLLRQAQATGDDALAVGVLALVARMQQGPAGQEVTRVLAEGGWLDTTHRLLLHHRTHALQGSPLALSALSLTLTTLQHIAALAAAQLAGDGWAAAAQLEGGGQVMGRVAAQVSALAAKCLVPAANVGVLVGNGAGCAVLVRTLNLAALLAASEALGAACGCPLVHLPAHTTTWPGLEDAVGALLEAAPDLLVAAALGSASVEAPSHLTQPCCSPGEVVQAAVQLAGIQAVERVLVRGEGLQAGWGAGGGGGGGAVARVEAVSCVVHMCGHGSVRASALYYLWTSVLRLGRSCSSDGSSTGMAGPASLVDGVGQVVVRELLDAAGGEQAEGRVAGTLGLWALGALGQAHSTQAQGTRGAAVGCLGAQPGLGPGQMVGAAPWCAAGWWGDVLELCVGRLGAVGGAEGELGSEPPPLSPTAALGVLPDLLLLTLLTRPPTLPPAAGRSSGSKAGGNFAPSLPSWVVDLVKAALSSPSAPLLHLLLSPPPVLGPWVHALSAQLVATGMLDFYLDNLREACQVSMWQGVADKARVAGRKLGAPAPRGVDHFEGVNREGGDGWDAGAGDEVQTGFGVADLAGVVQHSMQQVAMQTTGYEPCALNTAAVPLLLCASCVQHPMCCAAGALIRGGMDPGSLHHAIADRQAQLRG